MDTGIIAAIITGVVGPIITYWVTKKIIERRKRPESECSCEFLASREAMYRKAHELIENAKSHVLDTTWGADAPKLTTPESLARDKYIETRREVVKKGLSYKEIFTDTQGKKSRLQLSASEAKKDTTYQVRKIPSSAMTKPVIDFMVVDGENVILSHVRSERMQDNRFMFVKSKFLAQLFTKWFEDCWDVAKPVEVTDSV